jgi:hypothetical protein
LGAPPSGGGGGSSGGGDANGNGDDWSKSNLATGGVAYLGVCVGALALNDAVGSGAGKTKKTTTKKKACCSSK